MSAMADRGRGPVVMGVAAAPALLAALAMLALVAGALTGAGPLAPRPPATLVEAGIAADLATTVLLLRQGHNPNLPALASRSSVADGGTMMWPLEAAAFGGDVDTVRQLQQHGARLPLETARAAACFAAVKGRREVSRLIGGETFDPQTCSQQDVH